MNVARQNLVTAQAVANERAAQLAQTEIRAPTDGIVSKRMATLGNVVSVGQIGDGVGLRLYLDAGTEA